MASVMSILMSNSSIPLVASGWLEPAIVGGILLLAAGWLIFRAVRFFQGRTSCGCDRGAGRCPFLQISAAGATAPRPEHTAARETPPDPPQQA